MDPIRATALRAVLPALLVAQIVSVLGAVTGWVAAVKLDRTAVPQ